LRELLPLMGQKLENGIPALEVVVETIAAMEDSGHFNAGKGAVANTEGEIELDAALMDGSTARAGAAAAIRGFRNPIRCARAVMETRHILLAGAGAERYLRQQKLEEVDGHYFLHHHRQAHDTIGAVALDKAGRLAVATSTGGLSDKLPGRIGDSPLIGAGTYADGNVAVSCTGTGEYFIRISAAARLALRMEYGNEPLDKAAQAVIEHITTLGGRGGLIALDREGNMAFPFNSRGMVRGWVTPGSWEVFI
jgi:beta-aspartyl-peptidase (threonine type)